MLWVVTASSSLFLPYHSLLLCGVRRDVVTLPFAHHKLLIGNNLSSFHQRFSLFQSVFNIYEALFTILCSAYGEGQLYLLCFLWLHINVGLGAIGYLNAIFKDAPR